TSSTCHAVSGGSLLRCQRLELRNRASSDLDPARLERFGQLPLQVDGEQAVAHAGAGHQDIIREIELALKTAGGDTAMEIGFLILLLDTPAHHEPVLLGHDLNIVLGEPG